MRYCPFPYPILFLSMYVMTASQRDSDGTDNQTEDYEYFGEYKGSIGNNDEHKHSMPGEQQSRVPPITISTFSLLSPFLAAALRFLLEDTCLECREPLM